MSHPAHTHAHTPSCPPDTQTARLLSQMQRHRKETAFNAPVGGGGASRLGPIRTVFENPEWTLCTSALLSSSSDTADPENAAQSNFRWFQQQTTRVMIVVTRVPCFVAHVSEELFTDIRTMLFNRSCGNWTHTARTSHTDANEAYC